MVPRTALVAGLIVLLTGSGAVPQRAPDDLTPPIVPLDACQPTPQILDFTAAPSTVDLGTNTTLSWNVQVPSGCDYYLVIGETPPNWDLPTRETRVAAQQQVLLAQPAFNTTYRLTLAWGPNSWTRATTEVAVNLPLDGSRFAFRACLLILANGGSVQDCRHRVTIDGNSLAPLLVQALGTPNTTIIAKDGVELDLTPHLGGAIKIADGVQMIGERIAEPGKPFQPGPRLYVTPNPNQWNLSSWPFPLFQIDGYHVRISGVRIEGPGAPPDTWRAIPQGYTMAISFAEKSCKDKPWSDDAACSWAGSTPTPAGTAAINIEIDHNELSRWGVGVRVSGPEDIGFGEDLAGRVWRSWTKRAWSDSSGIYYPPEPEPIRIHDNHFHDIGPGNPYYGYGVNVGLGTHALIERNVFDVYYHAITSDGNFGTGYRAYRNLVLRPQSTEQQFDMHGRRCAPCPSAHDIAFGFNSFRYSGGPAIQLMGEPELQPYGFAIQSNVFAHNSIESALWRPKHDARLDGQVGQFLIGDDNLFGVMSWEDSAHSSLACDFDGDGISDSFLTTGQTWWYRSGDERGGPTPWVFLNTNRLLARDVTLVPRSGYRGCDVHAGGRVYPGGVGP